MKLKIVLAALAVATLATAAGVPAPAARTTRADVPLSCSRSYNPYREPVSRLRSCGDTVLMLRQVRSLPGGGKAYSYGDYTQLVPPAHFNVLKATDKQLREYGLPTHRQLGRQWYSIMRHWRGSVAATPYLAGVRGAQMSNCDANASTSCTWSGYAATGHAYTQASATWFEPDFVRDVCSSTEFGQWVGIGSFPPGTNGDLGQDGTAYNVSGFHQHQAWIETIVNYDQSSVPVAVNLLAAPDEPFSAMTSWDSVNKWYDYYMTNLDPNSSDPYSFKSYSGHSRVVSSHGSSAEVITETPAANQHLSDYQQFQVQDATAGWDSGSSHFGDLPSGDVTKITMHDPHGSAMSTPGTLSKGIFNMFWGNCD
jgi:hypothetical protein